MNHRCLAVVFTVIVGVALSAIPAAAQTAPRTAWGHPDLGGIWDFRTITPLQRPTAQAGKEFRFLSRIGATLAGLMADKPRIISNLRG